jgi:integrase
MAKSGKHPDRALTAVGVRNLKTPGRYADGGGLYLLVDGPDTKRWVLRTQIKGGRRTDIGLGGLSTTTLAEAREKSLAYRKMARAGVDPVAAKREAEKVVPTFAQTAEKVYASHSKGWTNAKHAEQWINSLKRYAYPHIGTMPVDQIAPSNVATTLEPIWFDKPETARRVRQRIGAVLDWSTTEGHRDGVNPVEGVKASFAKKKAGAKKHFPAMPYQEVSDFLTTLQESDTSLPTKCALEFLILTVGRTNEVIKADWQEIDIDDATWTVPASRMKRKVEHRVPLSLRALELLEAMRPVTVGTGLVFPGDKAGEPLSDAALLKTVNRYAPKYTVHGFRSSFRDWAEERTNFTRAVCEQALSHGLKDKTEAAYNRSDLFEKRHDLMARWSDYLTKNSADVVAFKAAKK